MKKPDHWPVKSLTFRLTVMGLLLAASVSIEFFFHSILGISRVYPHLYYIPIILASFWWGVRGGLSTSLFLSLLHIVNNFHAIEIVIWARALTLVFMGYVVGIMGSRRLQMEKHMRLQTHELTERIKELDSLYGISRLVEKEGISLEDILKGIVELIPSGLEFPEKVCTRIRIDGREYQTENFRERLYTHTEIITYHSEK